MCGVVCINERQNSIVLRVSPVVCEAGDVWCGVLKEDRTVMCRECPCGV